MLPLPLNVNVVRPEPINPEPEPMPIVVLPPYVSAFDKLNVPLPMYVMLLPDEPDNTPETLTGLELTFVQVCEAPRIVSAESVMMPLPC